LNRIEAKAFDSSRRLQSISIPRSVQALVKDWALKSALRLVVFASAASLGMMIEKYEKFEVSDGKVDFPGFSVGRTPRIHDKVRLVRCSS
jgi:hypothetical protein